MNNTDGTGILQTQKLCLEVLCVKQTKERKGEAEEKEKAGGRENRCSPPGRTVHTVSERVTMCRQLRAGSPSVGTGLE